MTPTRQDYERAPTLLEAVIALDPKAAARVWADLNRWEWPRDLPDHKPHWWGRDDLPEPWGRKYGLGMVVMDHVAARVPDDVIQAAWMAKPPKEAP